MALTWVAIWPFDEGTGTTVNEIVTGSPDLQGFGTNGTWNNTNGWGWINQFLAAPDVTGTNIDALNGAVDATLVVAFMTGTTLPSTGEIIAEIGTDADPNTNQRIGIAFNGSGASDLICRINNANVIVHEEAAILSADTFYVICFVYNSSNATAGDRAKVYINDVSVGVTQSITQNTAITFGTGTDEVKFGVPFGSTNGRVYWAGFATGAATPAEVASMTTNLTTNNDIFDPNPPVVNSGSSIFFGMNF